MYLFDIEVNMEIFIGFFFQIMEKFLVLRNYLSRKKHFIKNLLR